jgi:dihydroorotate dehydrogenase (NAD+) catalytic subunit
MSRPDLSVEVGAVRLTNPILCASGTFGYGTEHPEATAELGGIVTKTITLEPRAGNPPPRIVETPAGMLNSIGLQNVGVDRFLAEKLPELRSLARAIVVSVGGRSVEEFVRTVQRLDEADRIDAYEVNISCPNVREGGLEFCQNPRAAAEVIAGVRATTKRPIWAKLSPNVTSIGELARRCEEAGANAITAINTFVGMAVDIERRCAILPSGTGGLSGPSIRPLALARVREVCRSVSIPVVGVGGIVTGHDALEFLIVGAKAVQVGTSHFLRPDQGVRILEEMRVFLEERRIGAIAEIIGTLTEENE